VKAVKNVPLSGFMLEDDFALKLFRECASLLETKLKNRVKAVKNVPSPGFMLEDDFSFKLFCECALLPKKRHFYKQQKWHLKKSGQSRPHIYRIQIWSSHFLHV